jgi:hypothetical protein
MPFVVFISLWGGVSIQKIRCTRRLTVETTILLKNPLGQ